MTDYPIRKRSAAGNPRPSTTIERTCRECGASYLGLMPGKTGEVGIWDEWHWYCSLECAPIDKKPMSTDCPYCPGPPRTWGMSSDGWMEAKRKHDAEHVKEQP